MAMDSVTQILLGAAVGEAVLGRRVGRRALLWGGLCGLLPDLDVLIPYADAVKSFTFHRGFSHSIFVLTALTPIFVWLILKFHPTTRAYRWGWFKLVFLAFVTHILLDGLTVYGTQILWPLPTPPVMWSAIFIIDPAYSIPLLVGVVAAVVMSRKIGRGLSYRCDLSGREHPLPGLEHRSQALCRADRQRCPGAAKHRLPEGSHRANGFQHGIVAGAGDGRRGIL